MPFKTRLVIAVFMFTLFCGTLFGAGEVIYDIRVLGNRNIDSSLILSAVSLRVGDFLDPEEAAKSIKTLNNLSTFSSVSIDSEPYRTGVNLIITVNEYPIVDKVTLRASTKSRKIRWMS